jgi:hypothetical protein
MTKRSGSSSRDLQSQTVLVQARVARETCSGWTKGNRAADPESTVGKEAGSTLRAQAARRLRRLPAPAGGAAAPQFRPRRRGNWDRSPRRGWGRWGRKGASAAVR